MPRYGCDVWTVRCCGCVDQRSHQSAVVVVVVVMVVVVIEYML